MTIGKEVSQLERNKAAIFYPHRFEQPNELIRNRHESRVESIARNGPSIAKELLDEFADPSADTDFDPETKMVYFTSTADPTRHDLRKVNPPLPKRLAQPLALYMEMIWPHGEHLLIDAAYEIGQEMEKRKKKK